MNEANEQLEAELAALRPHDPTPQLRRRIAEHRARSQSPSSRWRWGLAVASGLAAACAVAVLLRWGAIRNVEPAPNVVLTKSQRKLAPLVAVDDAGFTFLMYRRALSRSPEELDALLARDAPVALDSNPELPQISAFTRSDAAIRSLLGDD
jgi:hypothetical protein